MLMTVKIGRHHYRVDLKSPCDISIPVSFGRQQLVAFGGAPARKEAYKAGSFVGDMRRGGSCNCEIYSFSPHLNGTHTEGVGHITKKRISVQDIATESLIRRH
jgi:arylformamidase